MFAIARTISDVLLPRPLCRVALTALTVYACAIPYRATVNQRQRLRAQRMRQRNISRKCRINFAFLRTLACSILHPPSHPAMAALLLDILRIWTFVMQSATIPARI